MAFNRRALFGIFAGAAVAPVVPSTMQAQPIDVRFPVPIFWGEPKRTTRTVMLTKHFKDDGTVRRIWADRTLIYDAALSE